MVTDAATVPEHIEHRVPLPDGRVFAAAEWGDPDGIPLISIHGTPGGRMSWWEDPDIYRRHGLRRITIDRPGYGESSRLRGRRVADIIPDLEHLTEALGIDEFVVTGGSGGGPHALACAALLAGSRDPMPRRGLDRPVRCRGPRLAGGDDRGQRHRVQRGARGRVRDPDAAPWPSDGDARADGGRAPRLDG